MKRLPIDATRVACYLLLCLVVGLIEPATAAGCPTCKDALHDGSAMGFAISIIFMMLMPFMILGFWTISIVRLRRQTARLAVANETNHE